LVLFIKQVLRSKDEFNKESFKLKKIISIFYQYSAF